MFRIEPSTILTGDYIELIPLAEKHFTELELLAREKRIWEFISVDMSSTEKCLRAFATALKERENGTQFPFVIYHKADKKIIGSTRLMNIETAHNKLEVGWTWMHPGYWATAVNLECKLLLLTFCFEELGVIRVQLKTDETNLRSRKAIQKIGAQYEGILRNDWIRDNGTIRNSVYFSIIHTEWQVAKYKIRKMLEAKRMPITKIKSIYH